MTTFPSSLDHAETIVATKRIRQWPLEWQTFVLELPAEERQLVGLSVALLDARPSDGLTGSEG